MNLRSMNGFRLRVVCWAGLILLGPPSESRALGPHEIAVLINENSSRSMEVANHYIRLRNIPPQNVVYLSLPDEVYEPRATITPEQFTDSIWEPAQRILEERGLDHILAWVYSVDFPIRIRASPPLSIQGITFARNSMPPAEEVRLGTYPSPLFAGPDREDGPVGPGGSLDGYRAQLGERMPLPSMMLGFMGSRGTDLATIRRYLEYGVISDGTAPRGTIYLVRGEEDPRAKMRAWQFEGARRELARAGIQARIMEAMPRGKNDIMGLMMGASSVDVTRAGSHRPGSMAEHATSFAGEFHLRFQTKLTDWLRQGATASAGPVCEPLSIWTKFPNARFFAHYARGNTLLESYFLSIRSPTQILLVGEPLASPWRPPIMLTLIAIDESPVKGRADFAVGLMPDPAQESVQYEYYLNGRRVYRTDEILYALDTDSLPDGAHAMRAVAYVGQAPLRHQAYDTLTFSVSHHERAVQFREVSGETEMDYYRPATFLIEVEGEGAETVGILHNERVIAQVDAAEGGAVEMDPRRVGPGPVSLQAAAWFSDGMEVRSRPLKLKIERLNRPPVIRDPVRETGEPGERILTPVAEDPDGDPLSFRWYVPFQWLGDVKRPKSNGSLETAEDEYTLTAGDDEELFLAIPAGEVPELAAIRVRFHIPDGHRRHPREEWAGLVFNYQSEEDFRFFGLWGQESAWVLAHRKNGNWDKQVIRGEFIQTGTPYDLHLHMEADGRIQGRVNDRVVLEKEGVVIDAGNRIGLAAGGRPVVFHKPRYAAHSRPAQGVRVDSRNRIHMADVDRFKTDSVTLEAYDGFHHALREIEIREEED